MLKKKIRFVSNYLKPLRNKKISILLADNSSVNIKLFQQTLTLLNLNCELFIVRDGDALINYISSNNSLPNYIFLDVDLPKIDGLTCLSYIKKKHPSNTFFIIMTTNNFCKRALNNSYRFGATGIINKDIEDQYFINIIKCCFKNLHITSFEKEFELNKMLLKTSQLEMI